MNVLVLGSLAYDAIMDFPDRFRNHILPDQIHMLNVCFVVEDVKKNFGGCAGNIAYTMNLLGGKPFVLSVVGHDGQDYRMYLQEQGIATDYITQISDKLTSQATIITDKDDNQITAYYNGASAHAPSLSLAQVKEGLGYAVVAPTAKEAMARHANELYTKKVPFVFDPGQQLPGFSGEELLDLIKKSSLYIANDYEMKLTEHKTGKTAEELCALVDTLIVTRGEQGSWIFTEYGAEKIDIAPCIPTEVKDPTGAGDAYRAGYVTALTRGCDAQTCGRVASVASAYAIEQYGTQNHTFTIQEFRQRYAKAYGDMIEF